MDIQLDIQKYYVNHTVSSQSRMNTHPSILSHLDVPQVSSAAGAGALLLLRLYRPQVVLRALDILLQKPGVVRELLAPPARHTVQMRSVTGWLVKLSIIEETKRASL